MFLNLHFEKFKKLFMFAFPLYILKKEFSLQFEYTS